MNHLFIACVIVGAVQIRPVLAVEDAKYVSFRLNDSLTARTLEGIRASIDDRFRTADSIFLALSSSYPLSPLGPLFVAGNVQAEMLDAESEELRDRFLGYVAEAERRAKSLTGSDAARSDAEFALGVAAGYRVVHEYKWGGWLAALKHGLVAKKHFQRSLELDSGQCDANLGLGSYHYWKSAKTNWINWLPLIPDARRRGIDMLIRAMCCGTFARQTARVALTGALINEERYGDAIAHADTLATLFPNARGPLWLKAKSFFALYEWDSAVVLFDALETRIRESGTFNYYNLIECAYHRAQCHWGASRYREALSECGKALTYPAGDETRKRQKKRLNELRQMQRKLVKMLSP